MSYVWKSITDNNLVTNRLDAHCYITEKQYQPFIDINLIHNSNDNAVMLGNQAFSNALAKMLKNLNWS